MKFKDKKLHILKELYNRKFDGYSHDIEKLFEDLNTSREEALHIGKSLSNDGLIKALITKDGVHGKILASGIELVEEEKFNDTSYSPNDSFTSDEKNEIIKRLDDLGQRLNTIEKGQEIIYDDLFEQIVELKELTNVLGKKDWLQILKGKMIDAGFGALTSEVSDAIVEIFKKQNLLGG